MGFLTEDSCLPILHLWLWGVMGFCLFVGQDPRGEAPFGTSYQAAGGRRYPPPSLPFCQGNVGQASEADPCWLAGWHRQQLPIMAQRWRARWPWDRPGTTLAVLQTAYEGMDGGTFGQAFDRTKGILHEWKWHFWPTFIEKVRVFASSQWITSRLTELRIGCYFSGVARAFFSGILQSEKNWGGGGRKCHAGYSPPQKLCIGICKVETLIANSLNTYCKSRCPWGAGVVTVSYNWLNLLKLKLNNPTCDWIQLSIIMTRCRNDGSGRCFTRVSAVYHR